MRPGEHPSGKPERERLRIETRFWEKVDWGGEDECWEWNASTHPEGYGSFRVGDNIERAHRVAYELDIGVTPGSLDSWIIVRHMCHTPGCCNPRHLEPGTRADNMRDSLRDGRIGSLSADDVRAIRAVYAEGDVTLADLADRYGSTKSMMHHVVKGKSYSHVPMPPYDTG